LCGQYLRAEFSATASNGFQWQNRAIRLQGRSCCEHCVSTALPRHMPTSGMPPFATPGSRDSGPAASAMTDGRPSMPPPDGGAGTLRCAAHQIAARPLLSSTLSSPSSCNCPPTSYARSTGRSSRCSTDTIEARTSLMRTVALCRTQYSRCGERKVEGDQRVRRRHRLRVAVRDARP
jgi:hypothetical protein